MIEPEYHKKISIKCHESDARFPVECLNIWDTTELEIIGGSFTYFPPDIGLLKNLKKLSVVSTKVSVVPQEVFELPNLEYLNLKNNRIESLPALFQNNQIKELLIGRNFLAEKALTTFFSVFKQLQVLDLGHNLLQKVPESLIDLKKLRRLNLESNLLSDLSPRLKHLPELAHLCLLNNPFPDAEKILIAKDFNIQLG